VPSNTQLGRFCSNRCHGDWLRSHPNLKWQLAGQAKMRAKFAAMTPEERKKFCDHPPQNTPRVRKLIAQSKMGDKNPMKRPEVAAKVSATIKRKWTAFFSSQLKKNWKEGIVQFNPNARIGI